jgi:CRP/FNR family transcriptional regulator, anaerobic regulatory protein
MDIKIQKKLADFFGKYKLTTYKKGEIIIRADEEPSGVFLLKEGIVRMYAISTQGEELSINIYKPLSFFPLSWVLNDSISHYYFEAITQVTTLKSPKTEFLEFLKNEPDVLFNLVQRIYKGLEGYFTRMEYLMSGNAEARLITELLIYAKRFGDKKGSSIVVNFKLTEKDLASQAGITRETVSRELSKLKDKGLIGFKNKTLTIKDLRMLEEELSLI